MTSKQLTSLLIAAASIVAMPAFASGYGPAPFYAADQGAPASQRGMSAQTVATEQAAARRSRRSEPRESHARRRHNGSAAVIRPAVESAAGKAFL